MNENGVKRYGCVCIVSVPSAFEHLCYFQPRFEVNFSWKIFFNTPPPLSMLERNPARILDAIQRNKYLRLSILTVGCPGSEKIQPSNKFVTQTEVEPIFQLCTFPALPAAAVVAGVFLSSRRVLLCHCGLVATRRSVPWQPTASAATSLIWTRCSTQVLGQVMVHCH